MSIFGDQIFACILLKKRYFRIVVLLLLRVVLWVKMEEKSDLFCFFVN